MHQSVSLDQSALAFAEIRPDLIALTSASLHRGIPMMDGAAQTASPASSSLRQRIPYACEACRVSKAKCEPSNTEGICRRYDLMTPVAGRPHAGLAA